MEADKEFQRKIYKNLLPWKSTFQGRKAALLEGTKQVGKSIVAEMFVCNKYDSYILVYFSKASKAILATFDSLVIDADCLWGCRFILLLSKISLSGKYL